MTRVLLALAAITLIGCGHKPRAIAGPKDCTTEPNGDKIWYPDIAPFYPEGSQIRFETWPAVCQAGKWITNTEEATRVAKENQWKSDLIWAARSRILTSTEMQLLRDQGDNLFIEPGQTYRQGDIDREFNSLLEQQFLLRTGESK